MFLKYAIALAVRAAKVAAVAIKRCRTALTGEGCRSITDITRSLTAFPRP